MKYLALSLLPLSVFGCSGPSAPPAPSGGTPSDVPQPAAPTPPPAKAPPAEVSATPPVGAPPTAEAPSASNDPEWIASAVDEALQWEVMPGTSDEPKPGRSEALRTFFLAHPEYADEGRRAKLAEHACGLGTEGAHDWVTKPRPETPLKVTVSAPDWKVVVAHSSNNCTSDDWSWFNDQVHTGTTERGVGWGYGAPENDVLVVQRDGKEVARHALRGQGYLLVKAGSPPQEVEHSPADSVLEEVDGYFGTGGGE